MPVDFLSGTPLEALICNPRSQNGGESQTARATQWACAAASTVAEDKILMLLMILK
jgi:hypothetical protein